MKVLEKGNETEHIINCPRCRSVLSITTDDIIQTNPEDKYSTKGHVVCPVCKNEIKTYNGQFQRKSGVSFKDEDTNTFIRV